MSKWSEEKKEAFRLRKLKKRLLQYQDIEKNAPTELARMLGRLGVELSEFLINEITSKTDKNK